MKITCLFPALMAALAVANAQTDLGAAAGSSLARALHVRVYLRHMADFTAMNAVYAVYVPEPHPARTTVEVSGLPKSADVEIDVIALAG